MSTIPLILMAGLNLMTAATFALKGNYAMMVIFISYTVACVGFIFA
jgi:hypothetical protein